MGLIRKSNKRGGDIIFNEPKAGECIKCDGWGNYKYIRIDDGDYGDRKRPVVHDPDNPGKELILKTLASKCSKTWYQGCGGKKMTRKTKKGGKKMTRKTKKGGKRMTRKTKKGGKRTFRKSRK
jgi:hypothetical protein